MGSAKQRHQKVVKMHQMPGDIHRQHKIKMMEGKESTIHYSKDYQVTTSKAQGKSFRKLVKMRAKAGINRRLDREMKEEL